MISRTVVTFSYYQIQGGTVLPIAFITEDVGQKHGQMNITFTKGLVSVIG